MTIRRAVGEDRPKATRSPNSLPGGFCLPAFSTSEWTHPLARVLCAVRASFDRTIVTTAEMLALHRIRPRCKNTFRKCLTNTCTVYYSNLHKPLSHHKQMTNAQNTSNQQNVLPIARIARHEQLRTLLAKALDSKSTGELDNLGLEVSRDICEYLGIPFELHFGMTTTERMAEKNSLLRKIKSHLLLN